MYDSLINLRVTRGIAHFGMAALPRLPGASNPFVAAFVSAQCTRYRQPIQAMCLIIRSLEEYLELSKVPLNSEDLLDDLMPSQQEQDNVQAVLQEADHPSYWFSASKDGNRESHYRGLFHSY